MTKVVTIDVDTLLRLLRLATRSELRTTGPDVRAFMLAGKALSDAGMTYDRIKPAASHCGFNPSG